MNAGVPFDVSGGIWNVCRLCVRSNVSVSSPRTGRLRRTNCDAVLPASWTASGTGGSIARPSWNKREPTNSEPSDPIGAWKLTTLSNILYEPPRKSRFAPAGPDFDLVEMSTTAAN